MTSATERTVNPPVWSLRGLRSAVTMTHGWYSWYYLTSALFAFSMLLNTWGVVANYGHMPATWMLQNAFWGAGIETLLVIVPALAAIRSTMRLPWLELGAAAAGAGAVIASVWGDYAGVLENLADYAVFGPAGAAIAVFCIVRPLTAFVSWIRRRMQPQALPEA